MTVGGAAIVIGVLEIASGIVIVARRVGWGREFEEFMQRAPLTEFIRVQIHARIGLMSFMLGSILKAGGL